MDKNMPLISFTVADAEQCAGRELTNAELERIQHALPHSTMIESFETVVFAVAGGAE